MAIPKGRAWKIERAGVNRKGSERSRSNKSSGGDKEPKPMARERTRCWVGSYTRADGTKIKGHFRSIG